MTTTTTISELTQLAARDGLVLRGGFRVVADDAVPPVADGVAAVALVLLGNVGDSLWAKFSQSPEYRDQEPHPLDRWSTRLGTRLATRLNGRALFPFITTGPPYLPFTRWAMRAEALQASRLGMLIHPHYGLWHAYRFALALPYAPVDLPSAQIDSEAKDLPTLPVDPVASTVTDTDAPPATDICARCTTKPCLTACPVQAFTTPAAKLYDTPRCFQWLHANPTTDCHTRGCLARLACPQGPEFRYHSHQARLHFIAFYRSLTAQFATEAGANDEANETLPPQPAAPPRCNTN